MKHPTFSFSILLSLSLVAGLWQGVHAQQGGCALKDLIVHIDFGRGDDVKDFNTTTAAYYGRIQGGCPTDGHYTFTSYSANCFEGDWHVIEEDHTPGDRDGNMMLVNAYPGGGVFFNRRIKGLKGNATYELALWLVNVCRLHICCSNLSPIISVNLATPSGQKVASFRLGELVQRTEPQWRKSVSYFTMPDGETSVVLTMQDNAIGGCGNDFALDDITFRECTPLQPVVKSSPKQTAAPVVKKPAATPPKPVVKKEAIKQPPEKTSEIKTATVRTGKDTSVRVPPVAIQKTAIRVPAPQVIRTRSNPLIRQIETEPGELTVSLYDNGTIDGDTVSIYHNNELVVSKARLSQKPITLQLKVDATQPYHELIMVADNLGSIPPNTSVMIVTAGDKRYKVFISSSEQKNAKVVVALKE